MKIINRGRGTGKTVMLIHSAYITGASIIVFDNSMKEHVLRTAKDIGCEGIEVITLEDIRVLKHFGSQKVLVDEADRLFERALECFLGCKIEACTMTIPIEYERKIAELKETENE